MVAWLLYIHPSSKSVAYDTTDDYYHQQRRSIRRLRKKVAINYVCFTDLALFMVITLAHYVVRPRLWTKDLSLQEVAVIEEQDVLVRESGAMPFMRVDSEMGGVIVLLMLCGWCFICLVFVSRLLISLPWW